MTEEEEKKKKPPNVFQTLTGSIFTAAHKEMWTQRNKDHHKCNNRTSATAVEKIDKQVQFLYNKIDSVLTYKHDKYFPITLEQRLQQLLKKKQQWVLCWRVGICNSEKRAKKEAANKTLSIWQYFTKNKKSDSPTKQNRHNKRDQAAQRTAKRLYNQRIFVLFPIVLLTDQLVALLHYKNSNIPM